jgi:hypothetical protein
MALDWNQFDGYDLTESHISVGEWGESGLACRGTDSLWVQFIP